MDAYITYSIHGNIMEILKQSCICIQLCVRMRVTCMCVCVCVCV